MEITSPSFKNNGHIPVKFTCDGENVNPELIVSQVPEDAASLVLVVEDPDSAGKPWVHWLLWNIDPGRPLIAENSVPDGAVEGWSDFGFDGWGGPCPPGGTHRYVFSVYALDAVLDIPPGAGVEELRRAMENHILAECRMMGFYGKKGRE